MRAGAWSGSVLLALASQGILAQGPLDQHGHDDHLTILKQASEPAAHCDAPNNALESLIRSANEYLESSRILSAQTFDLFDLKNNTLDPLVFNDKVNVQTDGETCIDRKCVTVFGSELCTPKVCAAGKATAKVLELRGVSTLRFLRANCVDVHPRQDGLYGVGEVQLTCGDLAGDVYAEASARLNGMEVPVSTSGSLTIRGLSPRVTLAVELTRVTTDNGQTIYQAKSAQATRIELPYDDLLVNIPNLGLLNALTGPLVSQLQAVLDGFVKADGVVDKAMRGQMPRIMRDALPRIDELLRSMPI